MIYKIGLLGAGGRMGMEVAGLLREGFTSEGNLFELSDAIDQNPRLSQVEGVEVRTLSEDPREPVHAWIDFSRPEATLGLLEVIDTPIVICTTGFDEKGTSAIHTYAKKHPVLLASNTSIGMNIMMHMLNAWPGRCPPDQFDAILSEEHHKLKKDAPSGTAKSLLKILEENGFENTQVLVTRAGDIRGVHSVKFVSGEEVLEIRHQVNERAVFAKGALLAASFLLGQKTPRLYTMEEALFSSGAPSNE